MNPAPRSSLFVPAHRLDRLDKARASGADAVIVDLEDAVAPQDKAGAREALAARLDPARALLLRINAADTPWFDDDCALLQRAGVAGVLLPKAERIDAAFARLCTRAGIALLPMIETAVGLDRARELAATAGVACLVFGSIDFQFDLGITEQGDELLPFRAHIVLASRLAGIGAPLDGVSTAIDDPESLREDCLRSRRQGFAGRLCIHPRQVDMVNRCYAPTPQELQWAQRVLDAAERSRGAAVAVDGRMVDKPVMLRAQALLDEARLRGGAAAG